MLSGGAGIGALGAGWFFFLRDGDGGGALGGGSEPEPPLDQMDVRFVDIRKPDVGVTSATIPMIVAFHNPTERSIPDISGDVDIFVNDTRVGSEELTVNGLEPDEETMVNLDVIVEYKDYGQALVDALRSRSFTVRLEGSLNAGSASRTVTASASL